VGRGFRIYPCSVTTGRPWRFSIEPPVGVRADLPGGPPVVSVTSVHDFRHRASVVPERGPAGGIVITFTPELPGEYRVGIYEGDGAWPLAARVEVSFYAEAGEIVGLVPWKGDLHTHTVRSDGRETPAVLLSRMRSLGMDYVAITDHRVYGSGSPAGESRTDARTADDRLPDGVLPDGSAIDLLVLPGEEINFCQGLGHIVSLNARRGVFESLPVRATGDDRGYLESFANIDALTAPVYAGVADEIDRLALPDHVDRRLYGFVSAIVNAVRGAGGLAVVAHPFWSSHHAMDLVRSTWDEIVRTGLFDAVEVFGGMSPEENLLSYAHYASRLPSDRTPVVGGSDTHGRDDHDWAGRSFTLAFAPNLSRDEIIGAIRSRRSTACLSVGEAGHLVAGDFRFVEYSYFLLRTFFPAHDERCRLLGGFYEAACRGEVVSADARTAVRGALEDEYRLSFPAACAGERAG